MWVFVLPVPVMQVPDNFVHLTPVPLTTQFLISLLYLTLQTAYFNCLVCWYSSNFPLGLECWLDETCIPFFCLSGQLYLILLELRDAKIEFC